MITAEKFVQGIYERMHVEGPIPTIIKSFRSIEECRVEDGRVIKATYDQVGHIITININTLTSVEDAYHALAHEAWHSMCTSQEEVPYENDVEEHEAELLAKYYLKGDL